MCVLELQKGENGFQKKGTFENYRTILNVVNKHYGWEPDVIYYDRMDNKAQEIADFIFNRYKIANTAQFKQKLSALSSLMTRTKFGNEHNIRHMIKNAAERLSVANTKTDGPIEDWTTLQPKLAELGKQNSLCGYIARIFSYGYVLRVAEIFTTRIDADDDIGNYLDLNNCKWYIRQQKNNTEKVFDVHPELCNSLKKSRPHGKWLLCKASGEPYAQSSQRLSYHNWPLASNNDLRKSYETWNRNVADRNDDEKIHWHTILGHNKETVKSYYDRQMLVPRLNPLSEEIIYPFPPILEEIIYPPPPMFTEQKRKFKIMPKLNKKIPIQKDIEVIEG